MKLIIVDMSIKLTEAFFFSKAASVAPFLNLWKFSFYLLKWIKKTIRRCSGALVTEKYYKTNEHKQKTVLNFVP